MPEDIDYRAPRGLDRRLYDMLLKGDWIKNHENCAIVGPTGVGKSWLGCALGHKACRDNHSVLYTRLPRLSRVGGGGLRQQCIEARTAKRFDHCGRTFVIVCSPEGNYFAIDGHCSHEKVHLADGIVDGHIIECPKHFGTFDYGTGEARRLPACIDLLKYEVEVEGDTVFIKV